MTRINPCSNLIRVRMNSIVLVFVVSISILDGLQVNSSFVVPDSEKSKHFSNTLSLPVDPNEHFFIPNNIAYLNVATLGPMPKYALETSVREWAELEANPCELYDWHDQPPHHTSRLDAVRSKAARMLGVQDINELAFVQSTTYALHMIAQGLMSSGYLSRGEERRVLTTNMEHPGGLSAWKHLVKSKFLNGIDYISIPTPAKSNNEILKLFDDAFSSKPKGHYAIVSVSHVLATTGQVLPISQLAAIAHEHGSLLIVDGAQSTGSIVDLNLAASQADAYTISGHKGCLGPTGSGLIYVRSDSKRHIQPGMLDDGYDGYAHSSGTAPFQTVLGLGYSLDFIEAVGGLTKVARHGQQLAAQTQVGLKLLASTKVPGLQILSPDHSTQVREMLSSIVTVSMPPGINVEDVIAKLKDEKQGRRFVVKKLADHKGAPKLFSNAIRISFHMYNSKRDVEGFLRALEGALEKSGACSSTNDPQ